jgi:8-oxo-dGTP pyrophosphatase MutT (NUDIX family)
MGGSALAGEDSKTAANRELLEEIGFNYDFSNSRPNFTINFRYGFDDYYIIRQNIDLDTLVLQEEEVKDVNWATKEEIINMIDDETFIPYHKELIRLIFEIHEHDGAIVE